MVFLGVVSLSFAAWFGRAAQHAGQDVVPWAAGGAVLYFGISTGMLYGFGYVAVWLNLGAGSGVVLLLGTCIASVVATIMIGMRMLPETGGEQLNVEAEATMARAATAVAELRCKRCGRTVTKRDALVQGALRIDDATCICADCKG